MNVCLESQIDAVMKQLPDSIKIPHSQLNLSRAPIGQGTSSSYGSQLLNTLFICR